MTSSGQQFASLPRCSSNLEICSTSDAVSLIIVNYNAGDLLEACVSSVAHQVDEVMVVDNASTDGSLEKVETVFPCDRKLKIVRNRENLGFAAGCNIGVDYSTGSCLLFLNPDCVLEPDSVKRLSQTLKDCPEVGMMGGLLVNPDGTEQAGGRRAASTPWRSFVRAFGLSRFSDRWPPQAAVADLLHRGRGNFRSCMLVHCAAMQAVWHWDEGYFLHCEDLDFSMTLRGKGWKIMFVPDAKIVHAKGGCSHSRPIFVE